MHMMVMTDLSEIADCLSALALKHFVISCFTDVYNFQTFIIIWCKIASNMLQCIYSILQESIKEATATLK